MFAKEKMIIRLHLILRNLVFHLCFWYCGILLYVFLADHELLFQNFNALLHVDVWYLSALILAISISLLFTVSDLFFSDRIVRFALLRIFSYLPPLLYFLFGIFLLVLASNNPDQLLQANSAEDIKVLFSQANLQLAPFLVYYYLLCILNSFVQRMIKQIGKGNFKNWVFGLMNKPRENERIFMFIDMKSSTSIAEKLSHKKFSHLVQDVFNDMAVVDNYMGEIYQYVGDGAIISWPAQKGLKNNNFLKAYFGFVNLVEKRENYYQRKYGVSPKFKAGIHVGEVMVLQVGQIRRDISYNGDTINTAARIESMCNEYNKNLLISSELFERMEDTTGFYIKEIGNLKLKGKRRKVGVCYVREKRASTKQKEAVWNPVLTKLNVHKKELTLSGEMTTVSKA